MKLIPILIASTITIGLFARTASATCNPCIKGSGCEAPCIDAGKCSCSVAVNGNFPTCNSQVGNYQFQAINVAPNSNLDYDITASIPGFSLDATAACPGYAICETGYVGSGDTWQSPYTTADGHVHWNVGSEGNGGTVTAVINAWPIIGTGYSNEPFGCGPDCNLKYKITQIQAVPGQGLQTVVVPGVTPGNSFNCVMGREGDLGLATHQGGVGALLASNVTASADNPTGGDSAYSYLQLLTLYRTSGGVVISPVLASTTNTNRLLGNNCKAVGFTQIYSNTEEIFWAGAGAWLQYQPSNEVTEAMCLLPQ